MKLKRFKSRQTEIQSITFLDQNELNEILVKFRITGQI